MARYALSIALVFGWLLMVPRADSQPAPKKASADAITRRMVIIHPGKTKEPIQLSRGEMLQIQPFRYPITPEFIGSTLSVSLSGDRCLELIGQASVTDGEGSGGLSAFLYARETGESVARFRLLGEDNKEIPGYDASYRIKVDSK